MKSKLLWPFRMFRYYCDFLALVVHSGTTWGVMERDPADWYAAVLDTPLEYEALKLEQRRIELTGRGFCDGAGEEAKR